MKIIPARSEPDLNALVAGRTGGRPVVTPDFTVQPDDPGFDRDPVLTFRAVLLRLAQHLAGEKAPPPAIEGMIIRTPDHPAFVELLPEIDLVWREVLAGNFPEIWVIEDAAVDGVTLRAAAFVPDLDPEEKVYGGFTRAELNFQYSPRMQTPNHEEYFARWRQEGAAFQKRRRTEVFYGPSPRESIDIFLPSGINNPPLHAFIHGGYWQSLDKAGHAHMAKGLLEAGVAVAMINYELMPEADIEEIVRQCRAALLRLYDLGDAYGYDKDRITVSGHSAGGHLAGVMACTDWTEIEADAPADLVKGVAPLSGLFDLEPLAATGMQKVLRFTPDVIDAWSPINMTPPHTMPVVLSAGGAESTEFHRQTQIFADHMRGHGCAVTLVETPGDNHFSIVEALCDPQTPLCRALIALARMA